LWRIRAEIQSGRTSVSTTEKNAGYDLVHVTYGFLFEAYCAPMWYFEVMDMIHKLLLTSVLPFIPQDGQMAFALCVVCAFLVAILLCDPYIRDVDGQLHMLVQVDLISLCFYAYLLESIYTSTGLDPLLDNILSALLVTLTVILFFVFLWIALRGLRKFLWWFRRKDLKSLAERADKSDADSNGSSATTGASRSQRLTETELTPIGETNGRVSSMDSLPPPSLQIEGGNESEFGGTSSRETFS